MNITVESPGEKVHHRANASTCMWGCKGLGYTRHPENPERLLECRCEVLRAVFRIMPRRALKADATAELIAAYQTVAKKPFAIIRGSEEAVMAIVKCRYIAGAVRNPKQVVVVTDADLTELSRRKPDDADEYAFDTVTDPKLLMVWLGVSTRSYAPSVVEEALRRRLASGRFTWVLDIDYCFRKGSPCHSKELEAVINRAFPDVIVGTSQKRSASKPSEEAREAKTPTRAPAAGSTGNRVNQAKFAGACHVCGGPIAKGGEFVWADAEKHRAHPGCGG